MPISQNLRLNSPWFGRCRNQSVKSSFSRIALSANKFMHPHHALPLNPVSSNQCGNRPRYSDLGRRSGLHQSELRSAYFLKGINRGITYFIEYHIQLFKSPWDQAFVPFTDLQGSSKILPTRCCNGLPLALMQG